jgi:putative ABC transport system ATP-binding protein
MASILSIENLYKTFQNGSKEVKVLDNINFSVEEGDSLSIVGASGSGKTTLLGLCAGLDKPSYGNVKLRNTLLNKLSEDELAQLRNQLVGFIFQNFQLIPTLTALENVMVPLELRGEKNIKKVSAELLGRVGLADRLDHYPTQLSGGEQQRVAIARAFSNRPKILFADEPTGNLDEETSASIEKLLFEINKEQGTTLILVTHDSELAAKTNHILRLKGGKVLD